MEKKRAFPLRIAFTHNLQVSQSEDEAEFDRPETVAAIVEALRTLGHEVEPVEVSGPASRLVARLEALNPELVFNTAEGTRGRFREGFYPALFDQLGIPYTGSDAYVCTVTLDKQFTKLVLASHGIPTPAWKFVEDVRQLDGHTLRFPVIAKPNFEGSSMGITVDSVVDNDAALRSLVVGLLGRFPSGVLVEEFIKGRDLVVPYLEAASAETGGVLEPAVYNYNQAFVAQHKYQLYDYEMKTCGFDAVTVKVPADITPDTRTRAMDLAAKTFRVLGIRDVSRLDFRVTDDGELYFLEINALPSLEEGASVYQSAALAGLSSVAQVLGTVVRSACDRQGLVSTTRKRARKPQLRVGLIHSPVSDGADLAVQPVRQAVESYGHTVVEFEATPEMAAILPSAGVDVVFNMAQGVRGRRREAQIPGLLELLDLEFTGSDSSAMSFAFDAPLCKHLVANAGCNVPEAIFLTSSRDKLPAGLSYPVIAKPVSPAHDSVARVNIARDENQLRRDVAEILTTCPAVVVETYIRGREFVMALVGERRPRVLPPMEVLFDDGIECPFRGPDNKQPEPRLQVPADIPPGLVKDLGHAARRAFAGLGCRDFASVVLRVEPSGRIVFLGCSLLPDLHPETADLVRVAGAAGIDYRGLIGEMLAPAMRRVREARRKNLLARRL